MSQSQTKYIITSAFPEPNYTQTPNKFFEMMPDMEHSEINVTLVLIRETFGYHRTGCKMGINKLAEAAGLSRNATKDGAEAAEKRGTFRRTNPDSLGEAEWELVIGQPVTTPGQPVTTTWSTSDSQAGIKERINKDKEKDMLDFILESEKRAQPIDEACKALETALGVNPWPWKSNSEWSVFARWVEKTYHEDNTAFQDYAKWRKDEGKYQAMTNNKIRQNPRMFMDTGWPTFLAHSSMYGKSNSPSEERNPLGI